MNASVLVESLGALIEKHGDLPVTIITGKYEYAASDAHHAAEGALPFLHRVQNQHPPERIVILTTPERVENQ